MSIYKKIAEHSQNSQSRYRKAVEWISHNDEPEEMEWEVIRDSLTVSLVADVFNKTPEDVAYAILMIRRGL